VAAAGVFAILPACTKERKESARSDLKEAGYELTPEGWFRASRDNDVTALGKIVSGGFDKNTRDAAGDTALHTAAAAGARDAAKFLLDRGIPVDARGADERTPLMSAVIAGQPEMVAWLLRQGADPQLKDKDGFKPIMLAVREGGAASVPELAAYDREDLDPALLMAALLGRTREIDALTNYGASVYARMDDGRTPLMLAAENGHFDAVKLLSDIGASRFTEDEEGRTAADHALAAEHPAIADFLSRDPVPAEMALENPDELAVAMENYVDEAQAGEPVADAASGGSPAAAGPPGKPAAVAKSRQPAVSLQGAMIGKTSAGDPAAPAASGESAPLVMRLFRKREMPVALKSVRGETAVIAVAGTPPREVEVKTGATIPGSDLVVVSVRRRIEDSKVSSDGSREISVVRVRDATTGATREWLAGQPAESHEPVALVEDAATGRRYLASPGQRFSGADGDEFVVSDVRPTQMVIRNATTGEVRTILLRGPRG
jgi:ankyrin repeat protein